MTTKLIRFHFILSVVLEIGVGLLIITDPALLFWTADYYPDPLKNNVLIIVGYMALLELILLFTRYPKGGYLEALLTGILLMLIAAGIPVYSSMNQIDVRPEVIYLAAYFAVSHAAYYATESRNAAQNNE